MRTTHAMRAGRRLRPIAATLMLLGSAGSTAGQSTDDVRHAITLAGAYRTSPNITYLKVAAAESKLDVYQSRTATTPNTTLVWIHGGNWVGGSKDASLLSLLPYLAMGWNVVNVEYRLQAVAPAPAAAEDCRCALRWVFEHAKEYNIDPNRVIIGGNSAGGHLSLLIAMADAGAGLDSKCPGPELPKVAAVLNWYGFPNLTELLDGKNMRPAVVNWIPQSPTRTDLAKKLSPVSYVRPGVPPVLTVHGDADPTSPYEYAAALHTELTKANARNQLVTIPNGKHGGFTDDESTTIFEAIRKFVDAQR